MVVILTIKEMSYLVVGLFKQFGGPVYVLTFVTLGFLPALFGLIRP